MIGTRALQHVCMCIIIDAGRMWWSKRRVTAASRHAGKQGLLDGLQDIAQAWDYLYNTQIRHKKQLWLHLGVLLTLSLAASSFAFNCFCSSNALLALAIASIAGSAGLGLAGVGAPSLVAPLLSFCFLAGDDSSRSSACRFPDIAAASQSLHDGWQYGQLAGR